MDDNLENLIADYLLDKMDSTARENFEQRLAAEPELAARVALEREVANTLDASSPENQLRANLRHISQKFDTPESLGQRPGEAPGGKALWWWAFAAGLLICAGWYFWNPHPAAKPRTPLPPQSKLESPTISPTEQLPEENKVENIDPIKRQQPIAAAFKPIPQLESYIGSQMRSGGFHIYVEEPKSGITLLRHSGQLLFRFSGKIEGALPAGTGFNLLIFSNNQKDFGDLRTVKSQVLGINPDGKFLLQKQWSLSQGLYYLVIEDQQSGEWLLVDKFLVKN
ncbi:MAG: hypothetical protein IPH31_24760 [Lewinellaceae bacterium]|nr:hypothetical protein [Lewinellaceae bacterium]